MGGSSVRSGRTLRKVEAELPAGFRFHPTDEELISDYLINNKLLLSSASDVLRQSLPFLIQVDLNNCEPWDIPEEACVGGKEWYFYSKRDRKYATGQRTNRATVSGYWKATGKDKPVNRKGTLVGMRKTLVFYQGRAPKGIKSSWIMHEFRIEGHLDHPPQISSTLKEDWVLCRVFYKNKEAPAKQGIGGNYDIDNDTISSSSLPPLMDSYNITFNQTSLNQPMNHGNDIHEQVPCLSIFSPIQTDPTFSHIITHLEPNMTSSSKIRTPTTFGDTPQFSGTSCLNPLISSEKKVIKDVLNHFTYMDTYISNFKGSPSFGEESSESFLSEVGFPYMWDPCEF